MAGPQTQLAFDREFAGAMAGIAEMFAGAERRPAGDVKGRREDFNGLFTVLFDKVPETPTVVQKEHFVPTYDGLEVQLLEFRSSSQQSKSGAAIYQVHGGGMIGGSPGLLAKALAASCEMSGLPIFAINYRKAPENPHPAPVNDCYAGLQWLHAHAGELGIDKSKIIIWGESAGGGIAAGTALMARDQKLSPPLAMQVLIYPMLDDRNLTPTNVDGMGVWRCDDNITGWQALLGKDAGSEKEVEGHAYAAPARAKDLSGLPPTYIDVGQLDIFYAEDLKYAGRLADVGVPVEFHLYPGLPHAFEGLGPQTQIVKGALANRQRRIAEFH
ncbi:hypothetical protein B0A50_06546 [Salinomyces thailandicus]|uniref:Alpha/beta hydrolase fold-3 domain-containing protein n=1 Tax=Salinomyces thailandicus TaxID=706561 RepID=A0A4U0TNX9_9PEZI|nr:hypothetical protein B0A50_06546 [Salinomyces thailandica]